MRGFMRCELVPTAETIAYLSNGPTLLSFEERKNALVAAAGALRRQLIFWECRSSDGLGASCATIVERGAGAIIPGTLFGVSTDAILSLASQYKIPVGG